MWGRETEPRTVLYFSLEDTLGRLQERLYQLVDAEEDPERLILQTESHGIGQGLEEQIVSFIHTYPDSSLIVIDTLQKVRKSDQNGSMYANDYKEISALKALADKYNVCILLIHHLQQTGSRRSVSADCGFQRSDGGVRYQLGHAAQAYEPDRQYFGDRARYGQQNTASARRKLRLDTG